MILYELTRTQAVLYVFVGVLILVVPACYSKPHKTRIVSREPLRTEASIQPAGGTGTLSSVWALQAKAADIPIALGARLLEYKSGSADQGNGFYLCYKVSDDLQHVILFYQQEMERLGWQLEATLLAQESICLFRKPRQQAVVLLCAPKNKSDSLMLTVYVMDRSNN